jgi:hypothetical protein
MATATIVLMSRLLLIIIMIPVLWLVFVITTHEDKLVYLKPQTERQIHTEQAYVDRQDDEGVDNAQNEFKKETDVEIVRDDVTDKPFDLDVDINEDNTNNKSNESLTSVPADKVTEQIAQDIIYSAALKTVVNIICTRAKNEIVTASGAIINTNGYVLSVAHVTEGLSKNPDCDIRRGAPAKKFGKLDLIYVDSDYNNASSTTREQALSDISIWKIRDLSQKVEYIDIDFDSMSLNDEHYLTFTYPAEFLSGDIILSSFYPVFSTTQVVDADSQIIRSKSSLGSQKGSSGGLLIDPYTGSMKGLIFGISPDENAIADRELFSITPRAINEATQRGVGLPLLEYLDSNP